MLSTIHGYRQLDFTANDGKEIKGTQLFISFKDSDVIGEKTEKVFLRPEIEMPSVKVGDTVDILYNNRGKVESIRAVKA